MSFVTLEVEIRHGRVVVREPDRLPEQGTGLLTLLPTSRTEIKSGLGATDEPVRSKVGVPSEAASLRVSHDAPSTLTTGTATDTNAPSLWDRMKDLVIEADDLPTDLSTQKAYLEGYGRDRSA